MYFSSKVYVSGFGYGTAHWSGNDYRTTLCGRRYEGVHQLPDEARMCGNCARIMKKDAAVAHVYALADDTNWELDRTKAKTHRYDGGWDFDGRSDEYLREAFDLWATEPQSAVYQSGMRAILAECHTRALALNEQWDAVAAREAAARVWSVDERIEAKHGEDWRMRVYAPRFNAQRDIARAASAADATPKIKAGAHMASELFPGTVVELMHRTTEAPVSWVVKFREHSQPEYVGTRLELPASVLMLWFDTLMEAPEEGARYRMVYGLRVGREIVLQRKSMLTDFHNRVAGFDPEAYWHYEEVEGTVIDEDDQMPIGNIHVNALRRRYERLA